VRLGPREQFLGRGRRRGHRLRVVHDQRPGRHLRGEDAVPLTQLGHPLGVVGVDVVELGQLGVVVRSELVPQVLRDTGGQAVGAGQHQVDVEPAGVLLRLDLRGQFGRRGLGGDELGDDVRVGLREVVEHALRKLQVAGDVDDVDRLRGAGLVGDRGARVGRLRLLGLGRATGDHAHGERRHGEHADEAAAA
jgi:hypothetical protein